MLLGDSGSSISFLERTDIELPTTVDIDPHATTAEIDFGMLVLLDNSRKTLKLDDTRSLSVLDDSRTTVDIDDERTETDG